MAKESDAVVWYPIAVAEVPNAEELNPKAVAYLPGALVFAQLEVTHCAAVDTGAHNSCSTAHAKAVVKCLMLPVRWSCARHALACIIWREVLAMGTAPRFEFNCSAQLLKCTHRQAKRGLLATCRDWCTWAPGQAQWRWDAAVLKPMAPAWVADSCQCQFI